MLKVQPTMKGMAEIQPKAAHWIAIWMSEKSDFASISYAIYLLESYRFTIVS